MLLPILVWVLDIPPNLAVVAAVAVVGAVSLFDLREAGAVSLPRTPRAVLKLLPPVAIAGLGAFLVHMVPIAVYKWAMAIPLVGWGVASILLARKDGAVGPADSETGNDGIAAWSVRGFALGSFGASTLPRGMPGASLPLTLASGSALIVFWRVGDFRWNAALPALVALTLGIELGKPLARRLSIRAGGVALGTALVGASIATVVLAVMRGRV